MSDFIVYTSDPNQVEVRSGQYPTEPSERVIGNNGRAVALKRRFANGDEDELPIGSTTLQ